MGNDRGIASTEHTTDDEGGEAPCFAHLLEEQMSDAIHPQFVTEPADASDER
jgi:hypothetical protein